MKVVVCRNIILRVREIIRIVLITFVAFLVNLKHGVSFKRLKLLKITGFVVLKVSCKVIL